MGFTTGMVICRDGDGCVAVELTHGPHQGCHSDEGDHPENGHQQGQGEEEGSCSDSVLAAQRAERVTHSIDSSQFFAMNFIATAQSRSDCTLDAPVLLRPSAAMAVEAGVPRAEAVGLRAIVLLV